MFRPNQIAMFLARRGRDLHSREVFDVPREIAVALVKLEQVLERTTVRADSSASRGAAEEIVVKGTLLVDPAVKIRKDDRIEFAGTTYRVIMTHPRFTVFGTLDHTEIGVQAVPV